MRVRHLAAKQSRQEPAANDRPAVAMAGTDRRRTGSGLTKRLRRNRSLGNGTGRTSGLMAARARTLGIEPPIDGGGPAHKPSRLLMHHQRTLLPPRLVPRAMLEAAERQERINAETAALWGDVASNLAAFDLPAGG